MIRKQLAKVGAPWLFVAGVGVGVLMAFPFAAPVFGAVIPEAAATLWGSALGALIAVAGAFWVADRAQHNQQRNAAAFVASIVHGPAFAFDELTFVYGAPSDRTNHAEVDQEPDVFDPEKWEDVRSQINFFLDEYQSMLKTIHRIDATLNTLIPEQLTTYLGLESELELACQAVKKLQARADEPGLVFYPGHPSWGMRFALGVHNKHIQDYVNELKR